MLVGGGHAHLQVLESFRRRPPAGARVTFVVDTPIAVYSGMVPGFVAGQYRQEELEIDAAGFARRAGAQVIIAPALGIDVAHSRIHLDRKPPLSYDVASFDIGSTVAGLDIPGIREHAIPSRPIGALMQRLSESLDQSEPLRTHDAAPIVVVGGGAGGVELAFTLNHRLSKTSPANRVLLLEAGPRILQDSPPSLLRRVRRLLGQRNIAVCYQEPVIGAEPGAVHLASGETVPCEILLWVTGAEGHPIFRESGLATDRRGFARVRSTLQFEHHGTLFGAGDCVTPIEYPNLPKAGVHAVRQGGVLADNIRAALAGRPLRSYKPQRDFLTLLNLGDGTAVGSKWGFSFEGRWVMKLKDWIDRRFVRRFQEEDRRA